MTDKAAKENVLVTDHHILMQLGIGEGWTPEDGVRLGRLLHDDELTFVNRGYAENNSAIVQVIPYVLVCRSTYEGNFEWLRYKRPNHSNEGRLRGFYSLGVGGHVTDADDTNPAMAFAAGMDREISEELGSDPEEFPVEHVGFVYDPHTPVGRVHVGVVYVMQADGTLFDYSAEIEGAKFLPESRLKLHVADERYESWSRYCIHGLMA